MATQTEIQEIQRLMLQMTNRLSEAGVDSVQILATVPSDEGAYRGTSLLQMGCGNAYARMGSVRTWLRDEEDAYSGNDVIPYADSDDETTKDNA